MFSRKSNVLKYFLDKQREFQSNFFNVKGLTKEEKVKWIKEFSIELLKELGELLNEMKCKHHRTNDDVIYSNVNEEWIDVFKYLLNIALMLDMDEKQILELFDNKTRVVEQRYKQEMILNNLKGESKLVIFDIDDTIGDYSNYFCSLFNKHYGKRYNDINKLEKEMFKECNTFKHYYRSSGLKKDLPIIKGAKQVLQKLRDDGYKIIIMSARPYKKYFRIFSDTIYWLEKNGLPYDAIYFAKNKQEKLVLEFPQTEFFVEDRLSYANEIASMGYKVYLLNNKYNQGDTVNSNVIRINKLSEITGGGLLCPK